MQPARASVGAILVLVTVFSWAGTFPIAKYTLAAIDPFWLNTIRFVGAVAAFVAIFAAVEGRSAFDYGGRFATAAAIGVTGFGGFNLLAFYGLQYTSPEHVALVNALQAPMTALAVWIWRGTRPARFTLACMAVMFTGAALVITGGDPLSALAGGSLVGDFFALGAAASWVTYVLGVVKFADFSALRYTTLTCLPGAAAIIAISFAASAFTSTEPPSMAVLSEYRWQIAYLIGLTTVVGVLCWNAGIQRVGPLNAVLLANLIPVVVFAIQALRGAEHTPIELAGAALVIGALIANNVYLRKLGKKSFAR
jgi:drug/metabolite transporter (DMT)-like permease